MHTCEAVLLFRYTHRIANMKTDERRGIASPKKSEKNNLSRKKSECDSDHILFPDYQGV